MELAGAVWADLFLGALALVRRAFQKTIRFLARLCSRAGEKHDHCDMLNQVLIGENSSLSLIALPSRRNLIGYNRIRACEIRLSSKAPRREAPCRTSTSPYQSCLASGWLLQQGAYSVVSVQGDVHRPPWI